MRGSCSHHDVNDGATVRNREVSRRMPIVLGSEEERLPDRIAGDGISAAGNVSPHELSVTDRDAHGSMGWGRCDHLDLEDVATNQSDRDQLDLESLETLQEPGGSGGALHDRSTIWVGFDKPYELRRGIGGEQDPRIGVSAVDGPWL